MNKFLEEIQEQPEALKQTFCYYRSEEGKKSLKTVCALWKSGEYDRIVFTGMGSSYFISQAAATMISSASIPASAINAGELLHFQSPSLTERTLLIAVSQSGESYEVIELLKKQRRLPITKFFGRNGYSLPAVQGRQRRDDLHENFYYNLSGGLSARRIPEEA